MSWWCCCWIRGNLEKALRQLRNWATSRNLWIDAIRIDQLNENECGAQVAIMESIYTRANKVLVWLGDSLNSSELAFSLIHDIYERLHDEASVWEILESTGKIGHFEGLVSLFYRKCWSRIWVIQRSQFHPKHHCILWKMHYELERHTWTSCEGGNFAEILTRSAATYWGLEDLDFAVHFRGL